MIWVAEFSPVQRAFHVDTLERIAEMNRESLERGLITGFVPIFVAETGEEASDFSEQWREEHQEVLQL